MKPRMGNVCWLSLLLLQLLWLLPATAQDRSIVRYTLLDGSYLLDQCLVCGRPDIMQPLRGTFDLVLVQDTPPYTKYAVRNLEFTARPGWSGETHISGEGTYVRFEEFARIQDMTLAAQIKDSFTNRLAFFTNETSAASLPFPLIEVSVRQTNGTMLQTFSMMLRAAPVREVWFSTLVSFTSTNRFAPTNQISDGDLISNYGRIVRRNLDLVGRLGVMPITPDLGLDAVHVSQRGAILFSIPVSVWSETLGRIQHGDLLSSSGAIVKRNQALLAAFQPASTNDAGLDAVQVMRDGEILFSIQTNLTVNSTKMLSRGDILSDRGQMVMSHQQLLANFHPAITNRDFGLDALHIFSSGEIWFSVEESFQDRYLGTIQAGDILSSLGFRAFSNQELLADFGAKNASQDYGLDALYIITDTEAGRLRPRIVQRIWSGRSIHLEWDGEGEVFQLETATSLTGPWTPCGSIVPDLAGDLDCDVGVSPAGFFRLQQW